MEQTARRVPLKNAIAYGIGDIYGSGAFLLIGLLFLFFLTDYVGLSPALAGLVFAVGKGVDAITDPLMGYVSDITRSRHGRRRVYFLVGIVPVALSFVLLWVPPFRGGRSSRSFSITARPTCCSPLSSRW